MGPGDHDQVRSGLSPGLRKEAGGDPSGHTQKAGWTLAAERLPGWPESALGMKKEVGFAFLLPQAKETCRGPAGDTSGNRQEVRGVVAQN